MKKKGFTLIELLVVIAIIAMLLAILMPALNKVKKIAQRVICGTNLKGLGTAQTVYANDYDDEYTVQGQSGNHNWSNWTTGWEITNKNWASATADNISVGASLYLLVREADVSPKSFVCPASDQHEFSGKNPTNEDIVNLWDFGNHAWTAAIGGPSPVDGPINCVSYSYHMPYSAGQTPAATNTGKKGNRAADARRSAAFAVMADQNPYFEETKLKRLGANLQNYMERVVYICDVTGTGFADTVADYSKVDKRGLMIQNAYPHGREGQNVTYADGHNSWETRADVGVKNDNIYTRWTAGTMDTLGNYNRRGQIISDALSMCAPIGLDDSVLVNDGPLELAPTGP